VNSYLTNLLELLATTERSAFMIKEGLDVNEA
jgi:hypothetical protein